MLDPLGPRAWGSEVSPNDLARDKTLEPRAETAHPTKSNAPVSICTESTQRPKGALLQVLVAIGVSLAQRVNLQEKYDYP